MDPIRKIHRIVAGSEQVDGAGVRLVRLLGQTDTQDFDPFLLLDVALQPGAQWQLPVAGHDTLFIYVVEGDGRFSDSGIPVASHRAVLFGTGTVFAAHAGPRGVRFLLFAGRPLREPIAWGGPIVMNSQGELDQASAELDNGTFIRWPVSHRTEHAREDDDCRGRTGRVAQGNQPRQGAAMPRILHIKASPRGHESFSTRAAEAFLGSFLAAHRHYQSETLDLFQADIPEFRAPAAKAKYAVMSGKTPTGDAERAWKPVIDTISHFTSAGAYVVSSPMWNFGIPYRLKDYIDVITQPGLTFSFSPETGYTGLVTGRPLILVLARGGAYGSGTGGEAYDHQAGYLQTVFGFIGFRDIRTVLVEPTLHKGPEGAEAALNKAIAELRAIAADPGLVKA